ncbi:MAG: hypothetical protein A2297_00380 [Elusimicrobia bacterium RIFOXYB2_FULL_48_7]|nr:MAG: hypothetical protein A2297_00380 [Elusimicrobia bacterium RIFOXYB2_FULL_48_7]
MNPKQQKIYTDVNNYFNNILRLKNSDEFQKYLEFLKRVPFQAPFNNTLVFVQNPSLNYYATEAQWKEFGRTIKPNARPEVILMIFGPVEFVFGLEDTEGREITSDSILNWWKESDGKFDENVFHNTVSSCAKIGLSVKIPEPSKYFNQASSIQTKGLAGIETSEIYLNPSYKGNPTYESYGVLLHEIAHELLGHCGERKYKDKKGNTKLLIHNRSNLTKDIAEIEAELTAWIVFGKFGIEKQSEVYLANYVMGKMSAEMFDMVLITKVSGMIFSMSKKDWKPRIPTQREKLRDNLRKNIKILKNHLAKVRANNYE